MFNIVATSGWSWHVGGGRGDRGGVKEIGLVEIGLAASLY